MNPELGDEERNFMLQQLESANPPSRACHLQLKLTTINETEQSVEIEDELPGYREDQSSPPMIMEMSEREWNDLERRLDVHRNGVIFLRELEKILMEFPPGMRAFAGGALLEYMKYTKKVIISLRGLRELLSPSFSIRKKNVTCQLPSNRGASHCVLKQPRQGLQLNAFCSKPIESSNSKVKVISPNETRNLKPKKHHASSTSHNKCIRTSAKTAFISSLLSKISHSKPKDTRKIEEKELEQRYLFV